jgi:hypothetical protein
MTYYNPPMKVGEYTTGTTQSADLLNTYRLEAGVFRWVKAGAAISNAGGKAVVFSLTNGVPTGAVVETTTANDYKVAGVIPIGTSGRGGSIALTTTLAADSYFLIQLNGASQVQAANTTCTAGQALITTTTSGAVGSLSTTIDGANAVLGYLGYATNTAAATAAGQLITCVLTRVA